MKYTIAFIRRGSEILMLNRNSAPWMGAWNGVGGKLEAGETAEQSILREIFEETEIRLDHVTDKGIVTWIVDNSDSGGMYLFLGELPEDYRYETPRQTDEGILDWKPISWILDERNQGLATNIQKFMPLMLGDEKSYEHQCIFQNGRLMEVTSVAMEIIKRK